MVQRINIIGIAFRTIVFQLITDKNVVVIVLDVNVPLHIKMFLFCPLCALRWKSLDHIICFERCHSAGYHTQRGKLEPEARKRCAHAGL